MTKLSTKDVETVTARLAADSEGGYSIEQIRYLVSAGVLAPINAGQGPGRFYYFSVPQVSALAFVRAWVGTASPVAMLEKAMSVIMDFTEEQLVAEFKKGNTHLIPQHGGTWKLTKRRGPKDEGLLFDLEGVYRIVKEVIAQKLAETEALMENQPKRRGRRAGGLAAEQ